jgi:hypothetical protein
MAISHEARNPHAGIENRRARGAPTERAFDPVDAGDATATDVIRPVSGLARPASPVRDAWSPTAFPRRHPQWHSGRRSRIDAIDRRGSLTVAGAAQALRHGSWTAHLFPV